MHEHQFINVLSISTTSSLSEFGYIKRSLKILSVFGEHLISRHFTDLTPPSLELEGFISNSRCEIPPTTPSQSTSV
jgi:hypothetical protein